MTNIDILNNALEKEIEFFFEHNNKYSNNLNIIEDSKKYVTNNIELLSNLPFIKCSIEILYISNGIKFTFMLIDNKILMVTKGFELTDLIYTLFGSDRKLIIADYLDETLLKEFVEGINEYMIDNN